MHSAPPISGKIQTFPVVFNVVVFVVVVVYVHSAVAVMTSFCNLTLVINLV